MAAQRRASRNRPSRASAAATQRAGQPRAPETVADVGETAADVGERTLSLNMPDEESYVVPASTADSIRFVMGRIDLRLPGGIPRRLGVIGSLAGEGATSVSRAIALTLAADYGRRVCLLDLGTSPSDEAGSRGLAEVVMKKADLRDVIHAAGTVDLVGRGNVPADRWHAVVNSGELEEAIANLDQLYDHVVFDLPAIRADSDSLVLARHTEALIVVARHGVTPVRIVKESLDELAGLPVIGAVLNDVQSKVPRFLARAIQSW